MTGIIVLVGIALFALILILSALALISASVTTVRKWGWINTIRSLLFLLLFAIIAALIIFVAIMYI